MIDRPTESHENLQPLLPDKNQDNLELPLVSDLDEMEGAALPLVGGKAFRLARLRQQGFNVPPGLVLTSRFFEAQIQHARLTPLWAGSPDIAVTAEALDWLADALKTKPLARELVQTLNSQLDKTFGKALDSFAVRSSVIDEDHRDHTFAGIHLTELAVPRSMVPVAVTRCWASALSDRAIQYRQHHGMSIQSIRISVLVQAMLSPICSGVGFTINPLTGAQDELIIEATWGLGSALVSGEIQPYFYRLARIPPDYAIIEQRDTIQPPSEAETNKGNPLSSDTLAELAHQLEQIQALMGEPQDVEWAWQDEKLFILQTRPVTHPPEPQQKVDQEWTRDHYPEMLPELPSPFFGSLLERSQSYPIHFFRDIGLEMDGIGPYEKLILGRPYLNITLLKRAMARIGLTSEQFFYALGDTRATMRAINSKIFSVDWRTAWQARHIYRAAFKMVRQASDYLQQSAVIVAEAAEKLLADRQDLPALDRLAQLRQIETMYGQLVATNLCLGLGITVVTGLAGQLIAPMTKTPITTIGILASTGLKLSRDEFNLALLELSRSAAEQDQVKSYLLNNTNDFNDYVRNTNATREADDNDAQQAPPFPVAFQKEFDRLLTQYSTRSIYEADPGWPRYRDDPAVLLRILRQYVKNEAWLNRAEMGATTWQTLIDSPHGIERLFPWRAWLTRFLIKQLNRDLDMRDRLNSIKAEAMAACRQWALMLGQLWGEQGWLVQPEDIFYLKLEEIERVFRIESGVAPTLSSIIQARKETYQTYRDTNLPFFLKDSEISSIQLGIGFSADETLATGALVGLPISPGQARGTVVVVRHPDEFEKLADDVILVMPSTDAAWLALLPLASGLIVETGGLLSHGSVIAREYGLPAVANIPQATQRFCNGDKVLVDGSTGVVQLLESYQSS